MVGQSLGSLGRQGVEKPGGPELDKQPGPGEYPSIFPSTVCHLQAVSPRGAGVAGPLSGDPEGAPEWLLQPGPEAGEYLWEKED